MNGFLEKTARAQRAELEAMNQSALRILRASGAK